jgi:predicted ATP-grasp superfamily ATP-dependent carboligase
LLHFCKQQVRANPPTFGLSTYQRSCWDPQLIETGLRFFQHAGVRGLVNVQFKRDTRDDGLKLIECNHRFTAANELVRRAGINLARLTYDRALGRPRAPIAADVSEVWMWDPISDTKAMLALRAAGALTIRGWLRTLAHRQHLPLLCLDDPLPAFVRLGGTVRSAWGARRAT